MKERLQRLNNSLPESVSASFCTVVKRSTVDYSSPSSPSKQNLTLLSYGCDNRVISAVCAWGGTRAIYTNAYFDVAPSIISMYRGLEKQHLT